jgi:hypothetical protein
MQTSPYLQGRLHARLLGPLARLAQGFAKKDRDVMHKAQIGRHAVFGFGQSLTTPPHHPALKPGKSTIRMGGDRS